MKAKCDFCGLGARVNNNGLCATCRGVVRAIEQLKEIDLDPLPEHTISETDKTVVAIAYCTNYLADKIDKLGDKVEALQNAFDAWVSDDKQFEKEE